MLSNVCFNVLTYATPYKQRSMQTVARLPSDKPSGAGEGECPVTGRRGAEGTREAMWEMSPKNHCQGNVSLEHLATAWWWKKKSHLLEETDFYFTSLSILAQNFVTFLSI